MMDEAVQKKVDYWIRLSESDIETAEILFAHKKYLDCAFYCHQTIEKSLKACCWYTQGIEPPYTHNLLKLMDISNLTKTMSASYKTTITMLSPMNIEGRYPDEAKDLELSMDRSEWNTILIKTKELYTWMREYLKK